MTPYYERSGITILCGDAREILPTLPDHEYDAIITEPVWPNPTPLLAGADDPYGLWSAVTPHCPRLAKRLVVHLGITSDPRFLATIPAELPYIRSCWLRYARPGYFGRVLHSSDIAYVFGTPPPAQPGMSILPGECVHTDSRESARNRRGIHPWNRPLSHVQWLVKWFARWTVLDPFMGRGTTALACKRLGLPFVGIEISEEFCALAVERLTQDRLWREEEPVSEAPLLQGMEVPA